MAAAILTENDIRIHMMDKPELNTLVGGVRWSPADIEHAMVNTVAYFNESAPATGMTYTIEQFPFRYCLLTGVTGYLLRSAAINEASNQLDYSAENISVQDKNKAPLFTQLGNQFWEEFKTMSYNIKLNQYTSQLYGSIGSEFRRGY